MNQVRRRNLLYGLLAVLVAGGVWMAASGSADKTLEEAAEDGDAIAVIQVFYEKWHQGDVDGAMSHLTPSSPLIARNELEYVVAVEPPGWSWSVESCTEQVPGKYQCLVALTGDPVIDIMSPEAAPIQIDVVGNRLSGLPIPDYRQVDRALAGYADQQDPAGYEAVCTRAGPDEYSASGVVYNRACGAFLSGFVNDLAASLGR